MKMLFISLLPLFLAELRNIYVASQYLDARVTFVTEPQISKGRLDHYILLVIPAARNVPADVVEGFWKYAEAGGIFGWKRRGASSGRRRNYGAGI